MIALGLRPLDGQWIEPDFLKGCMEKVRKQSGTLPTVLVLSQVAFDALIYASVAHGYRIHINDSYYNLGLRKVVWADSIPEGEFAFLPALDEGDACAALTLTEPGVRIARDKAKRGGA